MTQLEIKIAKELMELEQELAIKKNMLKRLENDIKELETSILQVERHPNDYFFIKSKVDELSAHLCK